MPSDEAGLAEASLADDRKDAALAVEEAVEGGFDGGHFCGAADER
ncbi:MAG: hypothetical protein ABSD38_38730 [Syntrophorhabdales bacterium]